MKNRFDIDFIEFSFLVEACIPPRPIARSFFWRKVIDTYYHELTANERERLFKWINQHPNMEHGLEHGDIDCILFNARFDPDNQYNVTCIFDNKRTVESAFKYENKYYVNSNRWINEEYITKVEKL